MVLTHEDIVSAVAALRVAEVWQKRGCVEIGWSREQVENHWAGLSKILYLVFASHSQLETIWKLLMVELHDFISLDNACREPSHCLVPAGLGLVVMFSFLLHYIASQCLLLLVCDQTFFSSPASSSLEFEILGTGANKSRLPVNLVCFSKPSDFTSIYTFPVWGKLSFL